MHLEHPDELIPRAEAVYRDLAADRFERVGRQMTVLVRRALNENKVMGVWAQATDSGGPLVSVGPSFVRPSGPNSVVETPLSFESADLVGRIAYNRRGKIVGMLILRPDAVAAARF